MVSNIMRTIITLTMLCLSMLVGAANPVEHVTWTNPVARVDGVSMPATDIAGSVVQLNGATLATVVGGTSYDYDVAPGSCLVATDAWSVITVDKAGLSSAPASSLAKPVCSPARPVGLAIAVNEATVSTVTVSWKPMAGALRYVLFLNGKRLTTITGVSSVRIIGAGKCLGPTDSYSVTAVIATGVQSAMSDPVAVPRVVCSG